MTAHRSETHRGADGARLRSLDGLRGVAAFVVVVYHVSLIARPFTGTGTAHAVWVAATESPLKLGFAGTEAVQVFFVLSGFVLMLMVLRGGVAWPGYYVSRLLRLYLPTWAAILLAVGLVAVFPRDPGRVTADAWITDANISFPDVVLALREATLTPASYDTVNTLWSLRWEVIFSILLPVFAVVALALRRWAAIAVVACVGLMVAGRVFDDAPFDLDALVYLPTFLIGCLLAARAEEIVAWSRSRARSLFWLVLGVVSALVLIASWWTRSFVDPGSTIHRALWGLAGAGATGLVLVSIGSPLAVRVLEAAPLRWLGSVSFSLYLVHAPLLATLAFAWGDERWMLVGAVGVPLSVVVAWGFHRLIERPSHRIARWTGARADGLVSGAARRVPAGSSVASPAASPDPRRG